MWDNLWRRFKAYYRLDLDLVCEFSKGLGERNDYHDYPDSIVGRPWHFYTHTCKRCGKHFSV